MFLFAENNSLANKRSQMHCARATRAKLRRAPFSTSPQLVRPGVTKSAQMQQKVIESMLEHLRCRRFDLLPPQGCRRMS